MKYKNTDHQILRYAKDWYQTGDIIEDLKKICNSTGYDSASVGLVWTKIFDLCDKFNQHNQCFFREVIATMFNGADYFSGCTFGPLSNEPEKDNLSFLRMVKKMLAWLGLRDKDEMAAIGITDLEAADPNILPLA